MDSKVKTSLQLLAQQHPNFSENLETCYSLYEKRQWHQLTQQILQLCRDPTANSLLFPLYEGFVEAIASTTSSSNRMNSIDLSNILIATSRTISNIYEKILFLKKVVDEKLHISLPTIAASELQNIEGYINCCCEIVCLILSTNNGKAGEKEAADLLDKCHQLVQEQQLCNFNVDEIDVGVKANYYLACSEIDKVKLNFNGFYHSFLQYLSYVKLSELPVDVVERYAHDLAVAALLGSKIYNFGELLLHPIMNWLENPSTGDNGARKNGKVAGFGLKDILVAFNEGRANEFSKFVPFFNAHSLFRDKDCLEMLQQKISLMAILEVCFEALSNERQVSFDELIDCCNCNYDNSIELEKLLMKAMSLGLIGGKINQLAQCVLIDFVQPRVLGRSQLSTLLDGMDAWREKISLAIGAVNEESVDNNMLNIVH